MKMKIILKTLSILMALTLFFQNQLLGNVLPQISEKNLRISKYDLMSKKIKEDIKIIHLSDYHNEVYGLKDSQLLEQVQKENPNIIVLTGDMLDSETLKIDYKSKDDIKNNDSIKFLTSLTQIAPTYYILGNNEDFKKDEWVLIENELNDINFIYDNRLLLDINNQKINLIGLTDLKVLPKKNKADIVIIENTLKNILKENNNEYYNIVLIHRPDYLPMISNYPIDLVLSGHTHGGQILINKKPIVLPNKDCPYIQGLYKEKNTTLIVNQGLGTSGIKLRKDCPPEIGIINLKPIHKQ